MAIQKILRTPLLFISLLLFVAPRAVATSSFGLGFEAGLANYSRNTARIPADTGTTIDLAAFKRSTIFAYRIIPSFKLSKNHEIRGLWAPLSFKAQGEFAQSASFNGENFAAATNTTGSYKFNSYRIGYIYHFNPDARTRWRLGFIAKIRDAHIEISQNSVSSKKSNIGFVPLLHFGVEHSFTTTLGFKIDLDALAAPQGRAFDALLALNYTMKTASTGSLEAYLGYRTVEGGADAKEVYNFAWIHQGVLGLNWTL